MPLPPSKSDALSTTLWDIISEAQAHSAASSPSIPASASLHDFIVSKAQILFPGAAGEEDRNLLCQMSEMWGAYIGSPIHQQSLRFAFLEEVCGGEELIIATSFSSILSSIAALPIARANIQLNTLVTSISTTSRSEAGSKISLTTSNPKAKVGEEYAFDEIVMTTPLGWLKHHTDIFTPALPARLTAAIANISVGKLEKVYLTFSSAWWMPTANETEEFPAYTNWLAPAYAKATNPRAYPIECWNLAAFDPPNNHPTLLFYTYGDLSLHLTTLCNSLSPEGAHPHLVEFFKPYFSLFPNYDTANPACVPEASLATNWQNDELAGNGSYINIQVGAEDAEGDLAVLRHGCPERRLWLAGEHCSPREELGTATGAYLSGEAVAGRILREYGVVWEPPST